MWTEALEEIKRSASEFAAGKLGGESPAAAFDRQAWVACSAYGVMAATVPTEFGGRGQSLLEFVATMEGLGHGTRRLGVLFSIGAQVFGAVEPIRVAGTSEQKSKYLPRLCSGEWIAAHAVTEPDAGSDISGLKTIARRTAGGWRITGQKHCITNGTAADLHLVYARTEEHDLSCFLIDPHTPGVTTQAMEPLGLRGSGLARVAYDGVEIPEDRVLGKLGAGRMLFQGSIERERACLFAYSLGAMERQIELAIERANERRAGGLPIAANQAVSHRIAEMKLRLEISRLLLHHVAALKADRKRAPLEAAITKLYVSESFLQNSLDLVRVFGGVGFTKEGCVVEFLPDALGGVFASGTSEIQRNIIAGLIGLQTSVRELGANG